MTALLNGHAVNVRARLDQRHGDPRVGLPQRAGAARAREAAADDHDARGGPLREDDAGKQQRRPSPRHRASGTRGGSSSSLRRVPGGDRLDLLVGESLGDPVHDGARAAVPTRKSCMALTIAARSSPARRGTGDVTRAEAG